MDRHFDTRIALTRRARARELFFSGENFVCRPTKVSARTNDHVDRLDTPRSSPPSECAREGERGRGRIACIVRAHIRAAAAAAAVARARAALGYADERQIKMHNPGKSFRIFHNGREISLLAAAAAAATARATVHSSLAPFTPRHHRRAHPSVRALLPLSPRARIQR